MERRKGAADKLGKERCSFIHSFIHTALQQALIESMPVSDAGLGVDAETHG